MRVPDARSSFFQRQELQSHAKVTTRPRTSRPCREARALRGSGFRGGLFGRGFLGRALSRRRGGRGLAGLRRRLRGRLLRPSVRRVRCACACPWRARRRCRSDGHFPRRMPTRPRWRATTLVALRPSARPSSAVHAAGCSRIGAGLGVGVSGGLGQREQLQRAGDQRFAEFGAFVTAPRDPPRSPGVASDRHERRVVRSPGRDRAGRCTTACRSRRRVASCFDAVAAVVVVLDRSRRHAARRRVRRRSPAAARLSTRAAARGLDRRAARLDGRGPGGRAFTLTVAERLTMPVKP